jgi:hypothetical protein
MVAGTMNMTLRFLLRLMTASLDHLTPGHAS